MRINHQVPEKGTCSMKEVTSLTMTLLNKIKERKEKRKQKLLKSLDGIRQQLIDMGALKVYLFGSMAHETMDIDSDLDILVVMPANRTGRDWQKYIYDQIYRDTAADIFVYNENEFEDYRESHFLQEVIHKGRVIYEKP